MRTQKRIKGTIAHAVKASIDIQFNWIFILIVGVVFLGIIVTITMSQKSGADTQANAAISQVLATQLKSKLQSSNAYTEIQIPNAKFTFDCFNNNSNFRLGGTGQSFPVEIIFSDRLVESDKIQTWSRDFSLPFFVGRFLYIATPKTAFIFYTGGMADDSFPSQVFATLPGNMTKFTFDQKSDLDAKRKEYSKSKIICFNECGTLNNYDYLFVNSSSFQYGTVTFHKKGSTINDQTYPYLTASGLYGAIFSDNGQYYACQMERALQQYEIKRGLVVRRIDMYILQPALASNLDCSAKLRVAKTKIDGMANIAFNLDNFTAAIHDAQLVANTNELLVFGANCPRIY